MDLYESLLSPAFILNEQIAGQLYEVLPEQGLTILIMDRKGNIWPSNSEEYARFNISEADLKELRDKIDDGVEPVITQVNDCSVIAAQLATERSNCGYIMIFLPQYSAESTLINITLIETLLNQFDLIANLLEKNNLLYESQLKKYSEQIHSEITLN